MSWRTPKSITNLEFELEFLKQFFSTKFESPSFEDQEKLKGISKRLKASEKALKAIISKINVLAGEEHIDFEPPPVSTDYPNRKQFHKIRTILVK